MQKFPFRFLSCAGVLSIIIHFISHAACGQDVEQKRKQIGD